MITTSTPSTVIAVAEPVFTDQERLALTGFLAGYTGLTREAHALDLRQFTAALDAGVSLRDVQEAASHADPVPPCDTTAPAAAWIGTPPTSSPPMLPEPPGKAPKL